MRAEYDFASLNPRKNPYVKKLKQQGALTQVVKLNPKQSNDKSDETAGTKK